MSNAHNRPTSRKAAKSSRRAELRSREAARKLRGNSWNRPLFRSQRAILSSLRLIDSARRVIGAAESLGAERPLRATRQLHQVSRWMADAARLLQHACRGLHDSTERVARFPDGAAGAPQALVGTSMHWVDAARLLAQTSDWLEDVFAVLLVSAKGSIVPTAPSPPQAEASAVVVAPLPIAPRSFCARRLPATGSPALTSTRRQHSAPANTAEAARQVSRGRAPPFHSTCLFQPPAV